MMSFQECWMSRDSSVEKPRKIVEETNGKKEVAVSSKDDGDKKNDPHFTRGANCSLLL